MTNHKLTGKQPKSIRSEIEKGVFECAGIFFYVNTEAMSFVRMKRFYELLPVVTYGRKYTELLNFIHDMRMKMTTGHESFKQTYFEVATELTNWDQMLLQNGGDFVDAHIDDVLRFCALFCVTKDEDMTALNDAIQEEKINLWKENLAMEDFFSLARVASPRYRELLQTLWEESKENGGTLIRKTTPPDMSSST